MAYGSESYRPMDSYKKPTTTSTKRKPANSPGKSAGKGGNRGKSGNHSKSGY